MGKIVRNGIEYSGTRDTANNINYDGTLSGLSANTVQEAVDETNSRLDLDLKLIDGVPHWSARGADSFSPFNSGVVLDLSNAEFAYVQFIKGATYMQSVQINNGTTRNDTTMRTVDMVKMKADLCYFKYGEEYDGITCSYMSSGFTVKQDGKFYVYSTCPNYERNEIIDCKAGDIIAMVLPITTSDTTVNHINLVVAL